MPTPQERTALAFLLVLALGAAGVRAVGVQRFEADVARAHGPRGADSASAARALARQQAAVDSAAAAPKRRKVGPSRTASSRSGRSSESVARQAVAPPKPVDVNRAAADELERLPRVGPALARRIIEWRERHGPFRAADDLRHVRGIGPSTVRLLDSLVTFPPGHRP
jgi:competence ComEA-like helix-hairpin-helix protein